MKRRSFLTAAAGASVLATSVSQSVQAAVPEGKPFSKLPLKVSCSYGWLKDCLPRKSSPLDIFKLAAEWGFPAVEHLGAGEDRRNYDKFVEATQETGVKWSCIMGAGRITQGEMLDESQHDRLEEQCKEAIEQAKGLGCTHIVGLTGETSSKRTLTYDKRAQNVIKFLRRVKGMLEDNGITMTLETLNQLQDHQNFWLATTDQAQLIVQAVDSPNITQLFDIYHQQITEGNIIRNLCNNIEGISHIHIGDNPGRKQPGTGEINYPNVFKALAETKYDGYVAVECGHTDGAENAIKDLLKCFDGWA
ncbi:MAG: TIM barrel protein [Candidatus Hydrogenedentes bacterium]|nr:TIM barrel protein [Candidatus Hydrogenedentota bacterium]